jgi:MFS-type transporter involved in bile tolerance (Atg22 family)
VAGGGAVFSLCTGALAVLAPRFLSLACVGLVMGIAIGGVSPLLRQFPLDMVPSGSVSTVIGMIFGIGALGGFLGPVLVGTARAWTGTTLLGFAIIALPGTALVGVALRLSRG